MNSVTQRTLDAMDEISLSEMDNVSLMNRVDTKYVISESVLQNVLEHVKKKYRVLTVEQIRLSPYSTLYFDTPDCECFVQHQNGKLNRRKFRMREYCSTGASFLEVKHKNNKGRTDKRRIPIPAINESFSDEELEFLEPIVGSDIELVPQLWTCFSRVTLVDRSMRERATFDCDLDFRTGTKSTSLPGIVIAEIKQSSDDRSSSVRKQLRRLGIRPLRVSKYCIGSMLLKPELKSNRFKAKLLAIAKTAEGAEA